jgi:two-component system CheB/CheR fusion protein
MAAAGMPTIDLLVGDVGLPDGNGCDLLRLLNDRVGGGPAHAISLTGHGEEQWEGECRRAGYSYFLLKPVKFPELAAVVRALPPAEAAPALGGVPTPLQSQLPTR